MNDKIKALIAEHPFTVLKDANGNPSSEVLTAPLRVSLLMIDKLYTSKKYPTAPAKAKLGLIVPPGVDFSAYQNEARRVAMAMFGDRLKAEVLVANPVTGENAKVPAVRLLRWPWQSDAENKGQPGYSADGSGFVLSTSAREAPVRVIGPDKQPIAVVRDALQGGGINPALYAGMWVRAHVRLYAYPGAKNHPGPLLPTTVCGVGAEVIAIQKIADDEPLPTRKGGAADPFGIVAHAGVNAAVSAPVAGGADIPW